MFSAGKFPFQYFVDVIGRGGGGIRSLREKSSSTNINRKGLELSFFRRLIEPLGNSKIAPIPARLQICLHKGIPTPDLAINLDRKPGYLLTPGLQLEKNYQVVVPPAPAVGHAHSLFTWWRVTGRRRNRGKKALSLSCPLRLPTGDSHMKQPPTEKKSSEKFYYYGPPSSGGRDGCTVY